MRTLSLNLRNTNLRSVYGFFVAMLLCLAHALVCAGDDTILAVLNALERVLQYIFSTDRQIK